MAVQAQVRGLVDVVASAELLAAQKDREDRLVVDGNGDPAVWIITDGKSEVHPLRDTTWEQLADWLASLLPEAAREGATWPYLDTVAGGVELELTLAEVAAVYAIAYYIANDREHTTITNAA